MRVGNRFMGALKKFDDETEAGGASISRNDGNIKEAH